MLVRLFNKAAAIEHEPVDTGDGVLLYTSEKHLIDTVWRFPQESMSGLASHLGITKGALSQTAKKLEEKGYLERIKAEGNKKTVFLCLLGSGRRAYEWHRAYHAAVHEKIARELSIKEDRDRAYIRIFYLQLERIFDECPKIRRRISETYPRETND
ncbi:MAG: MarR family transcriptional regulator [Methanoregula sp.]|jgi:DNA-binding MarR family transcriptional regulator